MITRSSKMDPKGNRIVQNEELQKEDVEQVPLVYDDETSGDEMELEEHNCPVQLTPGRDPALMPDRALRRKKYRNGLSEEQQCRREETECKEMRKWKADRYRARITWKEGVPMGKYADYFTSYIGVLVRKPRYCPVLNIRRFDEIDYKYKHKMMEKLSRYFIWEGEHDGDLMKMMRERYRDSMYNLRADRYWPNRFTEETRRNAKPDKYTAEEWDWLLNYWGSKEFQDVSIQNQKNRKSNKSLPHNGGRKKNIVVAQQLEGENSGVSATRLDVYEFQHQKKGGGFSHPKIQENIEMLKALVEESHSRALQGLDHDSLDECFVKVLGEDWKGRVRGWGSCRITPTSLGITKRERKRKQVDEMEQRLARQEDLLAQQQEELEFMRTVVHHLQTQTPSSPSPPRNL